MTKPKTKQLVPLRHRSTDPRGASARSAKCACGAKTYQWVDGVCLACSLIGKVSQETQERREKLEAYWVAVAYWENEKYMFPESEWHLHEPKLEEFIG